MSGLFGIDTRIAPFQGSSFLSGCFGPGALPRSPTFEPMGVDLPIHLEGNRSEISTMIRQTISHYKVLEKLGEGGMGVVYRAEDTRLKRTVALKFLPPELTNDPEAKQRFIHEAQAASALQHNNICTIHDIDETDSPEGAVRLFIVMDCYEGEPLKEKIARGPMKLEEADEIAAQVASGLSKAHERGIVHRDIKPGNIIITTDGVAKIFDFGLAKLAGRTLITKTGKTLGTIAYMSPEQARGETVDHRTDIWSLGVMLYEMVTGQLPFRSEYEEAVVYSILNEAPQALTALRSGVPMELERIVMKALQKDRKDRYQHVDEFLVDLRRVRKDTEERGTAVSIRSERARRKIRWWTLLPITLVILTLMSAGVWFLVVRGNFSVEEPLDSIAVLPFQNLSGDPNQEYFCDGMTEALITELSKIKALRVISRTSAMQYKNSRKTLGDIAIELDVKALVEGSVLKVGNAVRINIQLLRASPEGHLWANAFDRTLENILIMQSEVARAVAGEIRVAVTPEEEKRLTSSQRIDPAAHDAYLKGRYFWNRRTEEDVQKALAYFQQAVEKAPAYALAYVGIADCYIVGGGSYLNTPSKEAFQRAKQAAMKALEIDEMLAEAHISLGGILGDFEWNLAESEREYLRGLELNPGYATAHQWYAEYLWIVGRHEESVAQAKRALELDPLSLIANTAVGASLYFARRYDGAIEQLKNTLQLDSTFYRAHYWLGLAYVEKALSNEAVAELHKATTISRGNVVALAGLGYAYGRLGQQEKAIAIMQQLRQQSRKRYVSPVNLAVIHAGLDQVEEAFAMLEKSYRERAEGMQYLKVNPAFDPLHSDPRFAELLKKTGLGK